MERTYLAGRELLFGAVKNVLEPGVGGVWLHDIVDTPHAPELCT